MARRAVVVSLASACLALLSSGGGASASCSAPGDWMQTAEAAWLARAAEAAGYRVAGCTGSAWIVRLPNTRISLWGTERPVASGAEWARLAGVSVKGDHIRRSWHVQGRAVWIEAGPSALDRLPTRAALAWLVLATVRVELHSRPVRLMPMPAALLQRCRSDPLVRAACPTAIPAVPGWNAYPRRGTRGIFGIERGAPAPGRPRLNRPPHLFHLEIARGLAKWVPWTWPRSRPVPMRDGLVGRKRTAVNLGAVTWGRRRGELALAPEYPHGGSQGGHVVFRWRQGGATHAIGLHAWEPFTEAVASLRAIVESIPPPRLRK